MSDDHANCFRLWTRGQQLQHNELIVGRYEQGVRGRALKSLSDIDDIADLTDMAERIQRRISYLRFLDSDAWASIRDAAIAAADGRCQLCNAPDPTHGHHRTYDRFGGNEQPGDVIALCNGCHRVFHVHCRLWSGTRLRAAGQT